MDRHTHSRSKQPTSPPPRLPSSPASFHVALLVCSFSDPFQKRRVAESTLLAPRACRDGRLLDGVARPDPQWAPPNCGPSCMHRNNPHHNRMTTTCSLCLTMQGEGRCVKPRAGNRKVRPAAPVVALRCYGARGYVCACGHWPPDARRTPRASRQFRWCISAVPRLPNDTRQ